jgi:hypothetical protein
MVVRRSVLIATGGLLLLPALSFAQANQSQPTLKPSSASVGSEVTVNWPDCKTDTPPSFVLERAGGGELLVPAKSGSRSPTWTFTVPTDAAVKAYPQVTVRCPTTPTPTNGQGGAFTVTPAAATPTQAADDGAPVVLSVVNLTKAGHGQGWFSDCDATGVPVCVELRDGLLVNIRNFKAWREKNTTAPLHLFLAGVELANVVTSAATATRSDSPDVGAVRVTLEPQGEKEPAVRKAWVQVLQAAMNRDDNGTPAERSIPLSIGPAGAAPFKSDVIVELEIFPSYTPVVVAFLLAVLLVIVVLAKRTNLLRDSNGADNPPYSLARHQMAAWFVVVIGAYLYIWLITGFFSSISTTALTLIGISGATGLVAVTMDAGKRTDAVEARTAAQAEHDALNKALNDPATGLQTQLKAAVPGSPTATELTATIVPRLARLQELKAQLEKPLPPSQQNKRWYLDLLSDESGISFHRLQMAIWTLVLVIVFIKAVYQDILMPDFDATLLGLMGISSTTYIGFKFPERPA